METWNPASSPIVWVFRCFTGGGGCGVRPKRAAMRDALGSRLLSGAGLGSRLCRRVRLRSRPRNTHAHQCVAKPLADQIKNFHGERGLLSPPPVSLAPVLVVRF